MINNTLDQTASRLGISRCLKLRDRAYQSAWKAAMRFASSAASKFAEFIEARGDFREFVHSDESITVSFRLASYSYKV
jgi:hypothetical protein